MSEEGSRSSTSLIYGVTGIEIAVVIIIGLLMVIAAMGVEEEGAIQWHAGTDESVLRELEEFFGTGVTADGESLDEGQVGLRLRNIRQKILSAARDASLLPITWDNIVVEFTTVKNSLSDALTKLAQTERALKASQEDLEAARKTISDLGRAGSQNDVVAENKRLLALNESLSQELRHVQRSRGTGEGRRYCLRSQAGPVNFFDVFSTDQGYEVFWSTDLRARQFVDGLNIPVPMPWGERRIFPSIDSFSQAFAAMFQWGVNQKDYGSMGCAMTATLYKMSTNNWDAKRQAFYQRFYPARSEIFDIPTARQIHSQR